MYTNSKGLRPRKSARCLRRQSYIKMRNKKLKTKFAATPSFMQPRQSSGNSNPTVK